MLCEELELLEGELDEIEAALEDSSLTDYLGACHSHVYLLRRCLGFDSLEHTARSAGQQDTLH